MLRQLSAVAAGLVIAAVVLFALGTDLPGLGGDDSSGSDGVSDAELGVQVYNTRCAACHGPSGEGQRNWQQRGPTGVLPPPPHDSTGHTWHHADGLLFRIVAEGGVVYAGPETLTGMPGFREQLSDDEIRAVIRYLKGFWGPEERSFQAEVSAADPMP